MKTKFANRFDIIQLIGGGSFGQIYNGIDMKTGEEVAMKIEPVVNNTRSIQLCNEAKIYRILDGALGFPKLKEFATDEGLNALVMEILGDSLYSLFKKSNFKFSLKTVLMIAEQLISRVQFLHSKGIIHNDIKPGNLITGIGKNSNIIYLIDFGLATKFRGFYNNQHIDYSDGHKFFGTPEFASINSYKGVARSRRDDLESIAYILIYFLTGSLPWEKVASCSPNLSEQEISTQILKVKENTNFKELCQNIPEEFLQFLLSVKALEFNEEPDYNMYKSMFRKLFIKKGYVFDEKYDWTIDSAFALFQHRNKNRNQKQLQKNKASALSARPPMIGFTASSPMLKMIFKKKPPERAPSISKEKVRLRFSFNH
ncbi:Casein kinase I isoform delta-like protein [Tritrichomonas foetus]|uniref:non-specific serine/threonine protein kinase n=1 Tax=Tritrichomonas foetus TaxID=1144522 RepID=A0A1J4KU23_9EUKA|nr:Casein kinase I isoform delta-like protein [Tritrichomonas foetus]|eukprot:OHT14408.1 Casein kinase I isoform delta-like protein [Tritrichomonas foetus]